MPQSIHRYFQVGTIHWMSYPPARYALLDSLRRIAQDDYFDAVEVTHMPDEETRREARRILETAQLRVCYGAQPDLLGPGLNPNAIDEAQRLRAEERLMASIDEAHELGAGGVAFLSGHWQEETKEEALRQLVKTTCNLCRYARTKGMTIELEVFDFDMAKKSLIGPAPLAARFAQEVCRECDNFGLIVDLSHFPTTYETSRFVIETLRPYITHLHFGNAVVTPGCEAYGDEHPRFGFAHSANGVEELADFLRVLRREGFWRSDKPLVLSMEVKPWGDEDAELVLASTRRALNRAWAMAEEDA